MRTLRQVRLFIHLFSFVTLTFAQTVNEVEVIFEFLHTTDRDGVEGHELPILILDREAHIVVALGPFSDLSELDIQGAVAL